jgi:Ca2+-binding EF-hand superfamily protein
MANDINRLNLPAGLPPVAPTTQAAAPTTAPAPGTTTPAAAPTGDQNQVLDGLLTRRPAPDADINNVNISDAELRALDNMMQTFLADGQLSKAEQKVYQEVRKLFSATPDGKPPLPPAPKPKPVDPPAGTGPVSPKPTDPVGGSGPNSPKWDHGQAAVDGRTFKSWGDPHEVTGDGGKFDNMKEGSFVKARSATGDFELQTVQGKDKSGRWPGATVNHAAAVKAGKDTVAYNGLTKTLTINGQPKALKDGETFKLPDGGSVTKTKDGVTITSPKGDKVNVHQKDNYIDVSGEIGPNRKDGEVRGSLGNFDADKDANNDLVGRDGKVVGSPKDKAAVDKFIEQWRTKPEENLFGNDPIGGTGPGTGDTAEVKADKELFAKLDLNEDNFLDGKEIRAEHQKYDINKDGKLDLMEFLKGRDGDRKAQGGGAPKPTLDDATIEAEFKARDVTGNGALTGTEIPADFKQANPNATKVTLDEYKAFRKKQEAEAVTTDKADFKKADLNEDATLDGKEVGMWQRFDMNKDGEVSEEEALKGRAEQRAAGRRQELANFLKGIQARRDAAGQAPAPAPQVQVDRPAQQR